MKLVLTLIGEDSWSRPVYTSADGQMYVDTEPFKCCPPNIYTKNNNDFEGESLDPVSGEFEFVPRRDTWD